VAAGSAPDHEHLWKVEKLRRPRRTVKEPDFEGMEGKSVPTNKAPCLEACVGGLAGDRVCGQSNPALPLNRK